MLKTQIHSSAFSILTCLVICLYTMNEWNVQCTYIYYVFWLIKDAHIFVKCMHTICIYTLWKHEITLTNTLYKMRSNTLTCFLFFCSDDGKRLVHTSKLSVVMWPCLPLKSVGFKYIISSRGYIVVAEKSSTVWV